jgi:putative toxin-antitoxin system antitoxin component (TIGR02293 family)
MAKDTRSTTQKIATKKESGGPWGVKHSIKSSLVVRPKTDSVRGASLVERRVSPVARSHVQVRVECASDLRAYEVVEALSTQYEVPIKDIAEVLDVTARTFSRWKKEHPPLSGQQSDRMVIVGDILGLGKKVLGDEEHVKAWLRKPSITLDNKVPLDLLKTETGRRKVEEGLNQIYHGFF